MTDASRPESQFLTIAEVAEMTRLSRTTVYRLVQRRELQAVRFGRSYRVSEKAVRDFILSALLEDEPPLGNRFE